MAECNCEYTPPEQRPCMTCRMREAVGSPTSLLAYVAHSPRCEALEVMWHKGPCTCGLSALLKTVPEWVKKHLGPLAIICTTCGDKKQLEQHDGTIECPNCKEP